MKNLIFDLCNSYAVSGDESTILEKIKSIISPYVDDLKIDQNNNLIATMGDKNSNRNIMLDAHVDQIGLIIKYIDDNGFLFFESCGGIDPKALLGSTVKILAKEEITGFIGIVPPHLLKSKNSTKLPEFNEIFIDTGLEVSKLKELVSVGDRAVFAHKPQALIGSKITAPALDNRAGVAAIIDSVKTIKNLDLNCKVTLVFSATEETSGAGSKTASFYTNPDEAIIVDVTFATSEGVTEDQASPLGSGPRIGVSPLISSEMEHTLTRLAQEKNIPYTFEVMGGRTGTNTDHISLTRCGVKSALLSIPLRYMHTPVEVIDINDVGATSQLISEYVKYFSNLSVTEV